MLSQFPDLHATTHTEWLCEKSVFTVPVVGAAISRQREEMVISHKMFGKYASFSSEIPDKHVILCVFVRDFCHYFFCSGSGRRLARPEQD